MAWQVLLKYPAIFLIGAAVALLATRAWGPRALRWGLVDRPGGRKIHRDPVPLAGGVAVFLGFHAACAAVFLPPWQPFSGQIPIAWWARFAPLSLGALALGLCDDRFSIKPGVKLLGQTALAVAAYAAGLRVQNVLGTRMPVAADFAATVAWYVALMNAFNLIDGVDGLAAGIATIAAGGMALSLVVRRAPGDALLFLGLAGACAGFLRYNFYPARVFLGDTGSLFIGFAFAALAVSTQSKGTAVAAVGVPMLAAGVPLFDAALAVWRRSVRRFRPNGPAPARDGPLSSLARADADHVHHRLLRDGARPHSQVALMLYGATAALVVVGMLISVFNDRAIGLLALTFLLGAYIVVRHLAWIELRDTGEAVLRGLARPVRRNRTLLAHVIGDAVILNGVFLLSALLLGHPAGPASDARAVWRVFAPVDVGLPFLALILARSYSRVWYLARVSEFLSCGLAVVAGYAAAFALQATDLGGAAPLRALATRYLFMAGLASPLVVGARAAYRVALDLLHHFAHVLRRGDERGTRALICGAGYRATLFIRQAGQAAPAEALDLVGMVDSDDALRDHFVHGVRVLGNYDALPRLLRDLRVEAVYVVEDIGPEAERRIREALRGTAARLVRWRIVEQVEPVER